MDNPSKGKSLISRLADRFNVPDQQKFYDSLKQTAFSSGRQAPTDAQMMSLLVVADQYGLNPWTKEIYAFPDKRGGIIPVVGVDGWMRIMNSHPEFNGIKFDHPEEMIQIDGKAKPCPAWIDCTILRKDREPTTVREYLDEVYRPAQNFDGPWQTHTKRFLRHKAIIQCARIAFGFAGIFDPDEAGRIEEQQEKEMGPVEVVTASETVVEVSSSGQVVSEPAPIIVETAPIVEPDPVELHQQQESKPEFLPPAEDAGVAFVDDQVKKHTAILVERAIAAQAFDTGIDYAKQTWKGSDQVYAINELIKAQKAAPSAESQ